MWSTVDDEVLGMLSGVQHHGVQHHGVPPHVGVTPNTRVIQIHTHDSFDAVVLYYDTSNGAYSTPPYGCPQSTPPIVGILCVFGGADHT